MSTQKDKERLELLQGTLDLLILRTLIFGPPHGQGIGRAIQQTSEDELLVEHGALYPALQRLEERGWIAAEWGPPPTTARRVFIRSPPRAESSLSKRPPNGGGWQRQSGGFWDPSGGGLSDVLAKTQTE